MHGLAVLFALTALLYASVGFGGGSTYSALLIVSGVAIGIVPAISLACNILVALGGTWRFAYVRALPWARALPLICVAAPMAFLGGLTVIQADLLVLLLGWSLLLGAFLLFFDPQDSPQNRAQDTLRPPLSSRPPRTMIPAGFLYPLVAGLGYLAGVVGIGGGIFLAPVLHLVRWARARQVAAFASLFILINSLSGLSGQLLKGQSDTISSALWAHWPLFVAVLAGGALGSHLGVSLLSARFIRRLTGVLVAIVALRLLLS